MLSGIKSRFPWDAIERDWRAGILTQAEISRKYGVDNAQLHRKAKNLNWQKDLKDVIRARALAVLHHLEGDRESLADYSRTGQSRDEQADDCIVNDAIQTQLSIVLSSRKRIGAALSLVDRLTRELHEGTFGHKELEALVQTMAPEGGAHIEAKRQALMRSISLGARAAVMVNLVNALAKLTALQRQAFGLEEKSVFKNADPPENVPEQETTDQDRARAILNLLERARRTDQPN